MKHAMHKMNTIQATYLFHKVCLRSLERVVYQFREESRKEGVDAFPNLILNPLINEELLINVQVEMQFQQKIAIKS